MQSFKKKTHTHPWYKRKGYLHFDKALTRLDAETYVTNPENIKRHRFSPLIHYGKISRKVERRKNEEKEYKQRGKIGKKPELHIKIKTRNIFYTSHIDGYIYSYYTYKIQKAYEDFVNKHNLSDHVIAYRPIVKDDIKYCNYHLANEIFLFIKDQPGCHILCFDISKFFDHLSPLVLKDKWSQILGEDRLPDDHFKVYESLINFSYVEEGQIIRFFGKRFLRNPRKHGLDKDSGGSLRNRICDYSELRQVHNSASKGKKKLIQNKSAANVKGIPQGTAISGLLSNIFMIDFDIALKRFSDNSSGCYRRYSDDICIVVPDTVDFDVVTKVVMDQLESSCRGSIELNQDKTEKRIYRSSNEDGFEIIKPDGKLSRVQYLGFHFDGKKVYIRNSSISKDRGKIVQSLKGQRKGKGKINTVKVFKERSPRKITPFDNEKSKGFAYYAERSSQTFGDSSAIKKQIDKNDRFIARAIKRERDKRKKP